MTIKISLTEKEKITLRIALNIMFINNNLEEMTYSHIINDGVS